MNRIKELRQARGWNQDRLAAELNTRKNTVSRYETETHGLDVETIHKLCDIFGVTADYLLGRSEVPTPELSDEEARLLTAFRAADDDTRDLVRLALRRFSAAEETDGDAAVS